MGIVGCLKNASARIGREHIDKKNIKELKNRDFSLIASNCNGAFILHDLKLQFRTPTVNLWFKPNEYIEFLRNLELYLQMVLEFDNEQEQEEGYPVGVLGGKVNIYFQHYTSREQARLKWEERCKRVNFDNLFILFTDRDGCTYQDMLEFDALPYPNKIIFTNHPHDEIKSAYCIHGFEDLNSVGPCFAIKNDWTGMKYYDEFPFVKWFNGEI